MTITLTLTPEEEAQLRQKAALSGQPAEDYALALLRRDFAPTAQNGISHAPSLAETLAGRVGLFDGDPTGVRAPGKEDFAEHLARKRQEGHL